MKRNTWPVGEYGIRPNGSPTKCFYCGADKGAEHRTGCVIRSRTVVIRTIVEHTVNVPEDWGISTVEFTGGSSCSNNLIQSLNDLVDRLDAIPDDDANAPHACTCGFVTVEYVREASEEDEANSQMFVEKLPT